MIIYEFKIKGRIEQYRSIDKAIRTFQLIRNKTIRFCWMDKRGIKLSEFISKQSAIIAKEFDFADQLNSQARQAATEGASFSMQRFYDNCKSGKPGKKGYPKFQKRNRSVEYKTTGWKLSDDRKHINFTDKCGIGRLKLIGTRYLHYYYQIEQIKRVRIVRGSDGYYVQFVIQAERNIAVTPIQLEDYVLLLFSSFVFFASSRFMQYKFFRREGSKPTGKTIGLDVELAAFYTDYEGNKVENPRHIRKSEKALKSLQRRVYRNKKASNNRLHAIKKLGGKHLKVSRQHQDFAVKTALCVVKSNDFVALEKLQI